MCWWTTEPERDASVSFYPGRRGAAPLESNMMNGFFPQLKGIGKARHLPGEPFFVQKSAEVYEVPEEADCCYFFNPFSVEILQKVLARILDSYYAMPRKIRLFFYYPSDEYVSFLMTQDQLMFLEEIDCEDLFGGKDPREKILIFEMIS